jgi:two-component system, sensor histidine kinase and response regulator
MTHTEEVHSVGEGCCVLVVEDNPLMKQTIESLLLSQNFTVYTSANGKEALEILKDREVDVIVCDVMMPKMDGYQLFQSLRDSNRHHHVPFVFLTALDDVVEIERGNEIGVDDYLTKPFEPREFLSIIRGKVVRSRNLKSIEEGKYEQFRKRVIHTLSHEFRTPLVAISTGTELLLDQIGSLDPEKTVSLLSAVQRGGQRLERLVSDFMLVQQIESGVAERLYESKRKKVSLCDLHSDLLQRVSDLPDDEAKRIKSDVPQKEVILEPVYSPHIVEIIFRLLQNSLKFAPETPAHVSFEIYAGEVCWNVKDYGPGFEVSRIGEAMQLFGQLDRQIHEQQGGGLGLPIACRLAAINRCSLKFRPATLEGFTASLALPFARP